MQRISGRGGRVGVEDIVDDRPAFTVSKVDQDVSWVVQSRGEWGDRGLTR
jgi:hypothetical protein